MALNFFLTPIGFKRTLNKLFSALGRPQGFNRTKNIDFLKTFKGFIFKA